MPRGFAIGLLAGVLFAPHILAAQVRIGVLGLYHPHKLELQATTDPLVVRVGHRELLMEPHSHSALISMTARSVLFEWNGHSIGASEVRASSRNHRGAAFALAVPGRVQRHYRGTLELRVLGDELVPIVTMDFETAVAMAVAAETNEDAPAEALKAQAVVARSYLLAGRGRHKNFDFCDLTHCQWLRDAPAAGSPAEAAARATSGLVLLYQGKPFAAMFSRSCGGETRSAAQVGLHPGDYPYYSVRCDVCRRSALRWTRRISSQDAAVLLRDGEAGRLAVNRLRGWKTVPSNNFTARREGDVVILRGQGEGHGIGLCQRGAQGMATEGAAFREILRHYFPNTTVESELR